MFRPLLAAELDFERLRYPVVASPKLDGIRAVNLNGELLSRTLRPIPNWRVRDKFRHLFWLDGELIVGSAAAKDCYRRTVSTVMTIEGEPTDVKYFVFDHVQNPALPFKERHGALTWTLKNGANDDVVILQQTVCKNLDELLRLEEEVLNQGFEGLIVRSEDGRYKYGRSTVNEGIMLKLKRFTDAEAKVVGFEELMHNANDADLDERGYTKRSSHMENQVPMNTLGALICEMDGVQFKIGTGFTQEDRDVIWENRGKLLGFFAKFKYFRVGMKDAPRHPVFLGWRALID